MLLELLTPDGEYPLQKQVTEYFMQKNYRFVDYEPTRKENRTYSEDTFTYLRNQLGHAERTEDLELYTNLGEEVTTEKIIQLVKVINDYLVERNGGI